MINISVLYKISTYDLLLGPNNRLVEAFKNIIMMIFNSSVFRSNIMWFQAQIPLDYLFLCCTLE